MELMNLFVKMSLIKVDSILHLLSLASIELIMFLFYCSVFGKTMENTREYRRIDLVNTKKRAERLAADPSYRAFHTFTEKLLAVERYTTKVELNKPIYTGAAVLELSKLLMLDFHYGYIKEKYPGEKSRLHFTDTDSLLYSIETSNIYEDMCGGIETNLTFRIIQTVIRYSRVGKNCWIR